MIVTTDIANIIFGDCKACGIAEMYQDGNIPEGPVTTERIVIHAKKQSTGKFWKKGFVEVNLCVPDLAGNVANLIRLNEIERQVCAMRSVSSYNGDTYRYSVDSMGVESDVGMGCHYVNIRLLFEILNVK